MGEDVWIGQAIGAASGLVGVAIGLLSSLFVQGRERRWRLADEGRRLKIERGEELHSLIKKWWLNQVTWFGHVKLCMTGVIDYNKFLELCIESNKEIDLKVDRIDLICSSYFPEILPIWHKCVRQIQEMSAIESKFKNDYKSGIFSGAFNLKELQPKMLATDRTVDFSLLQITSHLRNWTEDIIVVNRRSNGEVE